MFDVWFYVLWGAIIIGSIVYYVWLKRHERRMKAVFDQREAEILAEYEERTDPLWERIAHCDLMSREHLELAEAGEQETLNLSFSIAWAHQADIARAQLEEI